MKTILENHHTLVNDHDIITGLINPHFLLIIQKLMNETNYALAPANMAVYQIVESLKKLNLPVPKVYDEEPKEFNAPIVKIHELHEVDKIFVIAYSQKESICQKLFSIYQKKPSIIALEPPEEYIKNNQWSFEDIKKLSVCESSFEDIKEKHLLFVFDTHFSDVPYKVDMIADVLDAKVFWIGASPHCLNDKVTIIDNIDFFTMLACYRGKKKITIFSTAVYSGYIFANFIKKLYPEDLKVILYVYDYLPHICSFTYAKTLSNYLKLDFKQLTSEYYYAYKIIQENIVDALIFKDGDASFKPLFKTKIPSLCFPAFPDKKIFSMQKIDLPKAIDDLRLLHIGTILSRENEPESIYGNNFYDEFFEEIVKYQMHLDMYYMTESSEKVVFSYSQKLGSKKNVNFIKIGSINNETERFSKYHYGVIPFIPNENVLATSLHATSIPSKFFTYVSLGLPIITHRGFNTISQLVEKYKIGFVIEDFNELNPTHLLELYEEVRDNVLTFRNKITLNSKKILFTSFIKHALTTPKSQIKYIADTKTLIQKCKEGQNIRMDKLSMDKKYISSEKIISFSQAEFICNLLLNYQSITYVQLEPSIELEILAQYHQVQDRIEEHYEKDALQIIEEAFCFFFFDYSILYQTCIRKKINYLFPAIVDGENIVDIESFFLNDKIADICNTLFLNKEKPPVGFSLFRSIYAFDEETSNELYKIKNKTLYEYYVIIFGLCLKNYAYKENFMHVTSKIDQYYYNIDEQSQKQMIKQFVHLVEK